MLHQCQARFVQVYVAVVLALALLGAQAGEDRSHDELGHSIAADLVQVLLKAGLCKARADCTNHSRVLFGSSGKGLHFEIYDVAESQAIGEAFEVLGRRGRELPVGKKLDATFISQSKAADIKRSTLSKQPIHAKLEVSGAGVAAAR